MKFKKIAALSLATLMIASALTGCAKKTEEERVSREVLQTPVDSNDITNNNGIEYKEQFYFQNEQSREEFFIGFTDEKYYLTVIEDVDGYSAEVEQSSGEYTVDEDGNYIIYDFSYRKSDLYFMNNVVVSKSYGATVDPLVIFNAGKVYTDGSGDMIFVDVDDTKGKFLWFGLEHGKYDLVLTKGQQKPESIEAYLIDGATGVGKTVTLTAEAFTEFDTSATGETTVTVVWENAEYKLSCRVYEDGEYTPPASPLEGKYSGLGMTDEAYEALPKYITPDTTAEEFLANYTGSEPMFYYLSGNVRISVDKSLVKVDGWDTEGIGSTEIMHYRIKAEIDGVTYVYLAWVAVCEEGDEVNGFLRDPECNNENINDEDEDIWYIPRGTALDGITADFRAFNGNEIDGVSVSVSGYQAYTLGAQVITLSYGDTTKQQMVYVYDDSNVILSRIKLEGLKRDAEGNIDLSETKIIFVNCDGTTRTVSAEGYKNSIMVDDDTVTFRYNVTLDGTIYPFEVRYGLPAEVE